MGRTKSEPPNGELPVRTDATRIVAEKEAALAEAERKLAEARAGYDEDAIVEAEARVRALRSILGDLAGRHAAELEDLARDRARRWIEGQDADTIVREIKQRQQKAGEAIEAAVEAIRAEVQARQRWQATQAGVELLVARWPELRAAVLLVNVVVPRRLDYISRIAEAAGDVRDTTHRPLLTVGAPASATEPERRRRILRALYKALARGHAPEDVRAIIEAAPRPTELDETPAERERRELREEQHAAAVERLQPGVEETKRSLNAIPGSVGGGLGL